VAELKPSRRAWAFFSEDAPTCSVADVSGRSRGSRVRAVMISQPLGFLNQVHLKITTESTMVLYAMNT
jgi:hypothetical protein